MDILIGIVVFIILALCVAWVVYWITRAKSNIPFDKKELKEKEIYYAESIKTIPAGKYGMPKSSCCNAPVTITRPNKYQTTTHCVTCGKICKTA